jgi:four helix bundle protein
MQGFKNLEVWQKSHKLTLDMYRSTVSFPTRERFGSAHQLRSSALSVASNIAEGSARGGDAEFRRFAYIALASSYELECQLMIGRDLSFLTPDVYARLNAGGEEVRKMLWARIRRLEGSRT